MVDPMSNDPRLMQALALLRSVVGNEPLPRRDGAGVNRTPVDMGFPDDDAFDLLSSTDLLAVWLPELDTSGAPHGGAWNDYFDGPAVGVSNGAPVAWGADSAQAEQARPAVGPRDLSPVAPIRCPAEIEPDLSDDIADAATECLYDFVHALGRFDIEGAMDCIDDDFGTIIDAEREMDKRSLRLELERLLDRWSDGPLTVGLNELPEAIDHPMGVLIHCTVQFDGRDADDQPRPTGLFERVVWLRRSADDRFRIQALAPFEETPDASP